MPSDGGGRRASICSIMGALLTHGAYEFAWCMDGILNLSIHERESSMHGPCTQTSAHAPQTSAHAAHERTADPRQTHDRLTTDFARKQLQGQ